MKNFEWCRYTYLHRKAFEYCVRKLIHEPGLRDEMLRRAQIHDMDKMVMYLFLDQAEAQKRHTMSQPHHLENDLPRSYEDLVETVIDYECAPYTKPDKPLNAFDFTHLLMQWNVLEPDVGQKLISIMEELGIDNSSSVSDDVEGLMYISSLSDVTEEMIYYEILRYVNEISAEEFDRLSDMEGTI